MFKLYGSKELLKNIFRLVKKYLPDAPNRSDLIVAYREFLRFVQPQIPKAQNIEISYLWETQEINPFFEAFKEKSNLDDFQELFDVKNENGAELMLKSVQTAIKRMSLYSPAFSQLIEMVIHTFFAAPSSLAGGGSTTAAIGCIWVNLRSHWHEQDILEFLVHETTHNLIFLDEMCSPHYTDYREMVKSENYTQSAILNKPRPLDKVFHSILVSTEVLLFRQENFGHPVKPFLHPPTNIMHEQTRRAIDDIFASPKVEKLLTNHACNLLNLCREKLMQMQDNLHHATT